MQVATLFCNRSLHVQRADVSAWPKRASRSLGAEAKASAHHQGRVRGRRFDRRHSWDFKPFAGLIPIPGDAMSPTHRACLPFVDCPPRFIFVAESRRPKGELLIKKGR